MVTLTGVGFKVSYIVNSAAASIAEFLPPSCLPGWPASKPDAAQRPLHDRLCLHPDGLRHPHYRQLHHHGHGSRPALVQMGVEPIVAHFFVFYYGVLADITPPVALAAHAAAGMANSDPFKTGNTAFCLGLGKALVPFIFVFSPALLIVTKGFTWGAFAYSLHRLHCQHTAARSGICRASCWSR